MDQAPAAHGAVYLVEHYWPGLTLEQFSAAADRVCARARDMRREGLAVRYVHSTIVPLDEAAFCFFEAASQELVEQAYVRAGVRYERIVAALELVPQARGSRR